MRGEQTKQKILTVAGELFAEKGFDGTSVDSIANAERLSLSGHMACRHANLMLTQWPHLASSEGPEYQGSVL